MPTLGSGDIASVLPERDDLLFFASGVSNSQELRESQYCREVELLMEQNERSHIVYFSSLGVILGGAGRYMEHKKTQEERVKAHFPLHTIVRIGNITWGKNPHTLVNHFKEQLSKGVEPFTQNVYRHLIDKDEFTYWMDNIPDWSCEMNVPGRRMKPREIVKEIKNGNL